MQSQIKVIEANIERLDKSSSIQWHILLDGGKPVYFTVAHGKYSFSPAPWPAASLFLKGTADTVATAAGAIGLSVEVVQLKHYLMGELKRMQAEFPLGLVAA